MSNFAVSGADGLQELTDSVNYVLSNLGQTTGVDANTLTADTTTGAITSGTTVIAYLYQYMAVRYATSADGTVGFSESPTNATYFGVRNTNTNTGSTNPADYVWQQVAAPGFGTNKFLFYLTGGGRQIRWAVAETAPSAEYFQTQDGVNIDLDVITTTATQQIAIVSVYQRSANQPTTPTGGTYDFSTLALAPPAGWSSSVPDGTDPLWTSTNTFRGDGTTIVGPELAWTEPTKVVENGQDAVSNYNVPAYAVGTALPTTPTGGSWNFTTATGVAPTGVDATWSLTPPAVGVGESIYVSYALATIIGNDGTDSDLTWSTPVELSQVGADGTDGVSVFLYQVFQRSYTTPTRPGASGDYNFATAVATPPTGWVNSPAATTGTNQLWVTTAIVRADTPTGHWYADANSWSTPVQYAGLTAPTVSTTYSAGQYFIQYPDGTTWSPAISGGVVTTSWVMTVRRGTEVIGQVTRNLTYNPTTKVWSSDYNGGAEVNPERFTFGTLLYTEYGVKQDITYQDNSGQITNTVAAVVVQAGEQGDPGPKGDSGDRGFIPLAYVVTATNPTNYTSAQFTAAFAAPRTNTAAPIGTGYLPVQGDTAQFTYLIGPVTVYRSYDASSNTWQAVTGQVIDGNVLVSGTVTASKLSANEIYAINTRSTNATFGSTSSNGYWLRASDGDARFGGNVSIGANLNVTGLITSGALNSNTVNSSQIVNNAITEVKLADAAVTGVKVATNAITATKLADYAVTTTKLANLAVGTGQLATDAVTAAKILDGAITGGKIAPATITGTLIAAETITGNLIATGTISGNKIAALAITADKIDSAAVTADKVAANAITAVKIDASAITSDKIAANAVTTGKIAANSITANEISSSYIYAGNIVSTNATLGSTSSPGYWLRYSDGDARFGGNVSIGSNLSVDGLITAGALNTGVVTTNNIQQNALSQTVGVAQSGSSAISFYNNTAYWPNNTRGFVPISGGAAIIPTTTGNPTGSKIQVNYNVLINSTTNSAYNLVELWKNGSSSYYQQTFRDASVLGYDPFYAAPTADNINVVGDNGTTYFSSDGGSTWTASANAYNVYANFRSMKAVKSSNSYYGHGYSNYYDSVGPTLGFVGYIGGGSYSWSSTGAVKTSQEIYGSTMIWCHEDGIGAPTIGVGANGLITRVRTQGFGQPVVTWSSGIVNDLYAVAGNYWQNYVFTNTNTTTLVAVGANGTIIRATASYNGGNPTYGSWSQKISNTIENLNGVASNFTKTTAATLWVIVGDNGTLLTSPDGNTWTARTSGVAANLRSVTWGNDRWIAVGDGGVIITSTDGITWSNYLMPTNPSTDNQLRNLYSATYAWISGKFIVAGESVVLTATAPTSSGSWTTALDPGPSQTSDLTRLAYWGSWDNISTTTQPPATQAINNQLIAGTFTDVNYTAGQTVIYYLVAGNLAGSTVTVQGGSISLTELKR